MSNRHMVSFSLVLLIVGQVALTGCRKSEEERPGKPHEIRNLPLNLPPTMPAGSPGIKPRTTGTPAFSLDDAKEYVTTHRVPMGIGDRKPVITKAEFLTSKEVSDRLRGATTGFSDDYLLCYVELQGPVTFFGPPGAKVTYNRGVLIFDAHSGNLVIGGGLP